MNYYPDFFNDVLGPVMQPGSSSHMAGPCRLGLLAHDLLGENPDTIDFIMDSRGSFAGTFGLMNEDKGMLAGTLGFTPDDIRINEAYEIAKNNGIDFRFIISEIKESSHLNAIKFSLKGKSGKNTWLVGESTGGGMVSIRNIEGYEITSDDFKLIGDTYVILIFENEINAGIKSKKLVQDIVDTKHFTQGLNSLTCIKTSQAPDINGLKIIFPDIRIELLKPILPVVTTNHKRQQLFRTVSEWRNAAVKNGIGMSEAAIRYEIDSSLWPREDVINYMYGIKELLIRQIKAAYEQEHAPDNPFARYDTGIWEKYLQKESILSGGLMGHVVKRAIGVNFKTKGVPIVPGPMGTGGGYLFSALYSVKEQYGFSDEDLIRGLFIAAGIGAIAYTHTSPTGEIVGCGGECGVCCAMGSAAIVEMAGGNGEQIENAASLALQSFIGLPCDPVPGGYEAPCFSRAITAACMAVVFADLALAGSKAVIPFDEVLSALDSMGRKMPSELLCTSKGGCCATPTAIEQEKRFKEWFKNK